jgi:hypothetical protein
MCQYWFYFFGEKAKALQGVYSGSLGAWVYYFDIFVVRSWIYSLFFSLGLRQCFWHLTRSLSCFYFSTIDLFVMIFLDDSQCGLNRRLPVAVFSFSCQFRPLSHKKILFAYGH